MENREIDLLELAKTFKTFIARNFWFFVIIAIIGGAAGYFYSSQKKPVYTSRAIVSSWVEKPLLIKLLDIYVSQIEVRNADYISTVTLMPKEKAKCLLSFEFELAEADTRQRSESRLLDFINEKTLVSVSINAACLDAFENIEEYFCNYFNNNDNLSKMVKHRKQVLSELLDEVIYEIETHKSRNESLLKINIAQGSLLHIDYRMKDLLDLTKLKSDIEYEIEGKSIITFTQSFSQPVKLPSSRIKSILIFVVIFLFAGLVYKLIRLIK